MWQAILEEVETFSANGPPENPNTSYTFTAVRNIQQLYGLRGINDAILRREDRPYTGPSDEIVGYDQYEEPIYGTETIPLDGLFDNRVFYQLSDPQFSVIKTVSAGAAVWRGAAAPQSPVVDRVEYDPYGRGRLYVPGDFDFNGVREVPDITGNLQAFFAAAACGDANYNGQADVSDIFAFLDGWYGAGSVPADALPGAISLVDNPIGYCGYYYDAETIGINGEHLGGLYQVRHRVYDPVAGRWLQQDPAGFVDGMNLYEYVAGRVISAFDPMGLWITIVSAEVRERVKKAINEAAQRAANAVADSGAPQAVKDAAMQVVGAVEAAAQAAAEDAGKTPLEHVKGAVEGAVATVENGIAAEKNNAKRGAYTPGVTDYAMSIAAEVVGANGVAEGASGYSAAEDRMLTTEERIIRGGSGAAMMVATGSSVAATALSAGSAIGAAGRGKNHLTPEPNAGGAHSTMRRDPTTNKITHYETWEPTTHPSNPNKFQSVRRYDGTGAPHQNKTTKQPVPTAT